MNELSPGHEYFELMHKLVEYRHNSALKEELSQAGPHSMLHMDVLMLVHYLATIGEGDILEIGSFVGGSTIAAAMGARRSGRTKKIMSLEIGGRLDNHRLATRDIFKQLKKNLARAGVLEAVTLINAWSYEGTTIAAVRQALSPKGVGLFIFDADNNVRGNLDCYGDLLADRCWMVIDDYFGGSEKTGPIKGQVDELVASGCLLQLGIYGWGTWIGRWQGTSGAAAQGPRAAQ